MRSLNSQQSCQTLSGALEAFKLQGRIEGRSPRTLEWYEGAFNSLMTYVGDMAVEDLTTGTVRSWLNSLIEAGYAKTSINVHLRAVCAAFNWLQREGQLRENPLAHVRQLRVPKQFPYVLSQEQAKALITTAKERRHTWVGLRNYVIVATFIETMLRLNELIHLEVADVSLQARSIRVRHGKGDKERFVWMGQALIKRMAQWLTLRGEHIGEDRVFVTRQGNGLDARNIQRILARLAKKAGLEGVKVSPHVLRHTGATFLARDIDPFTLQRLLGHESIETTMIYVHLAGSTLREAHVRHSSVDRLLRGRHN